MWVREFVVERDDTRCFIVMFCDGRMRWRLLSSGAKTSVSFLDCGGLSSSEKDVNQALFSDCSSLVPLVSD